jgi:BirA family biotin operon repressor/biotin-[acetyl-CoA-carboxylase] ligase
MWTSLDVVDSLGSSNATLAQRALSGAAEPGAVLLAEEQTTGRGRRGRGWVAPKYSSVMMSVLVRPSVEQSRWGWLPLLTALAVVDAVGALGVQAVIKWPNDVLIAEAKLAGVLCEVVQTPEGPCLVAGCGINVHQSAGELPSSVVRALGGKRPEGAHELRRAIQHLGLGGPTGPARWSADARHCHEPRPQWQARDSFRRSGTRNRRR